jgi:hypothetical protein
MSTTGASQAMKPINEDFSLLCQGTIKFHMLRWPSVEVLITDEGKAMRAEKTRSFQIHGGGMPSATPIQVMTTIRMPQNCQQLRSIEGLGYIREHVRSSPFMSHARVPFQVTSLLSGLVEDVSQVATSTVLTVVHSGHENTSTALDLISTYSNPRKRIAKLTSGVGHSLRRRSIFPSPSTL